MSEDASATEAPIHPAESAAVEGTPLSTSPTPAAAVPGPRRLRALAIGTVIAAVLGAFLFFVTGVNTKSGTGPGAGPVVGIGRQAPNFSLPRLGSGAPMTLDGLGKAVHRPVILNFFGSWCTPCQEETPLLSQTAAAEQAKGSNIQFVGVDVNDDPGNAIAFVKQTGLPYPILADRTLRVTSGLFGLYGAPNTYFIGASGQVLGSHLGALTSASLDPWLRRLGGTTG
jgi:cytochrome c biogenesis protein CcmG/thiol:disulfide interchange protein DsbE